MDKYKKKTLKFSGMGKEIRTAELHTLRAASRNQRYSLLRSIEEDTQQTDTQYASKIPQFGAQESSRVIMLQRWKQDKMLKKQKMMKIQKPTFKVGVMKHDAPPVLTVTRAGGDSKLSKTQNVTRSQGTSFRVQPGVASNSKEVKSKDISRKGYNFTTQTAAATHLKEVKAKDSRLQPSFSNKSKAPSNLSAKSKTAFIQPPMKKPEVGTISNKRLPNKTTIVQSPIKKPEVGAMSHNKLLNKDSTKYSFNKKIPITGSTKAKGIGIKDPPAGLPKPVDLRYQNKKIDQNSATGLLKPVDRLQNRKVDQSSSVPKSNISRLPPMKPLQQQAPSRIGRGALKPPGASIPVKQTSIVKKTEVGVKQNLPAKELPKPILPAKKDNPKSAPDSKDVIFPCELSHIEPPVDVRKKSFAPTDFLFCAPIELNSSLYLENGPSAIFARMKGETERTSTPKHFTCNKSLREFESPGKMKEDNTPCESKEFADCKLSLNFQEVTDDPSKIQEAKTVSSEIHILECEPDLEAKDNSPESEKENYSPEEDFTPAKQFSFASDIISTAHKLDSTYPVSTTVNVEDSVFLPSDIPAETDRPKINVLENRFSNSRFVTQRSEGDVPKRSFRRSEKPKNLERINESPEDSTPISHKKSFALTKDFTPRRSMRLAKMRECSSMENLFDVAKPSVFATPECVDKPSSSTGRIRLTYDFEKLHLESDSEALLVAPATKTSTRLSAAQARKVSLLYTPPRKDRSSIVRKSIKGDLMSFSPTV